MSSRTSPISALLASRSRTRWWSCCSALADRSPRCNTAASSVAWCSWFISAYASSYQPFPSIGRPVPKVAEVFELMGDMTFMPGSQYRFDVGEVLVQRCRWWEESQVVTPRTNQLWRWHGPSVRLVLKCLGVTSALQPDPPSSAPSFWKYSHGTSRPRHDPFPRPRDMSSGYNARPHIGFAAVV